jgi:hypothetical protein
VIKVANSGGTVSSQQIGRPQSVIPNRMRRFHTMLYELLYRAV